MSEEIIYLNNEVSITIEIVDTNEAKVNINGKNLIWISRESQDEFKNKLKNLLDKYRI